MTDTPTVPAVVRRPRWPVAIVAVCTAAIAAAVVKGTWADSVARDPATTEDGQIVRLYQDPEGRKLIRCAAVLPLPREAVWATITDYEHFRDQFSHVDTVEVERPSADRARLRLGGPSPVGRWNVDVEVQHQQGAGAWVAAWDDRDGASISVNRGSWTLTSLAPDRTLVVYAIQLEVDWYPNWFVRVAQMLYLREVIPAVGQAARSLTGR